MDSTGYVLKFTLTMTIVTSVLLAGLFYATQDRAKKNEALFNKRAILSAIATHLGGEPKDMSDEQVLDIFNNKVTQYALNMEGGEVSSEEVEAAGHKGGKAENIDMAKEKKKPETTRILPLFVFKDKKDGKDVTYYIVSVRGNGLWDEIWGNIAIEDDFNTIVGASFDHKGETPGLGAEIKDNPSFKAMFNKDADPLQLYTSDGTYTSVVVRKGGAKDATYQVDGISGATVTCDGVTEMLERGIKYYEPYFNKMKKQQTGMLSK